MTERDSILATLSRPELILWAAMFGRENPIPSGTPGRRHRWDEAMRESDRGEMRREGIHEEAA